MFIKRRAIHFSVNLAAHTPSFLSDILKRFAVLLTSYLILAIIFYFFIFFLLLFFCVIDSMDQHTGREIIIVWNERSMFGCQFESVELNTYDYWQHDADLIAAITITTTASLPAHVYLAQMKRNSQCLERHNSPHPPAGFLSCVLKIYLIVLIS